MLTSHQRERFRTQLNELLEHAGVYVRPDEAGSMEVAELGLGQFEVEGLGLIVYENNDRYCAKELILLPGQTCPQHRHPPHDGDPGKMETFRCRWGRVYLYVDGPAGDRPIAARLPGGKEQYYTVRREIVLDPGQQFTIPPDTWHWFQSGPDGAVVSEFSSPSRDELDLFTDPSVRRVER